ncbi:MAG: hypothetical protein AAB426_05805 [Myxococcota bacterium]
MTPETAIIPHADPVALPAPVWLLQALLLFTFILHVVPMSMVLGGGFWAIVASRRGRESAPLAGLAIHLGHWLPVWTAAAITTGVATLLFLQVLYGQLFYPAGVAMAWPWLSVIVILLVGYYAYYIRSLRRDKQPELARAAGIIGWLSFLVIGFLYVNVMTLMLRPDRITASLLVESRGLALNFGEAMLWPRYVHMVLGAVAVSSLWIAVRGAWQMGQKDVGGATLVRFAARGFLGTTLAQVAVGIWFLFALPETAWRLLVGGDALGTTYLVLAVLLAFDAAWILWRAADSVVPMRQVIVAAVHLGVVVLLMVLIRDLVRRTMIAGVISWQTMTVAPQWDVIAIFFVLLFLGLATLGWMLLAVRRADARRRG